MGKKDNEYTLAVKISGSVDKTLPAAANQAEREMAGLAKTANAASKNMRNTFTGMDVKGINALAKISDKVFSAVAKAAEGAAVGIAAIAAASTYVGASFEAQMSTVQSISQASSADMEKLSKMAKKMGAETKFSATEAGQALEYMGMAGWKTNDMLAGIEGIMDLAAASGEDLALTSDIVTDALTAFKLSASDSSHFADVLAAASANSNTNVAMLGESFKYAAPLAGAFGFSVEDTALMLGLMANSGIKASQGGTSLRKLFTQLSGDLEILQDDGSKFIIQTSKENGKMRDLKEIIDDVRVAFNGMSESEVKAAQNSLVNTAKEMSISLEDENGKIKTQAELYAEVSDGIEEMKAAGKVKEAEGLTGKTGMAGLLAIINSSQEDYDKLANAIDNADGAAERMKNIRLDNLIGDATILKSSLEGAGISIYEGLSNPLRELTQTAIGWVNSFTASDFLKDLKTSIPTLRRQLIGFGRDAKEGFAPLLAAGNWFLDNPDVLSGTLAGIGAALLTFKAAKAAMGVAKTLSTISNIIGAWPVAVAGLAIGAITGIAAAVKTANNQMKRQSLAEHFGDITLSMEELQAVAHDLVYTDAIGKAMQAFDKREEMKGLQGQIEDSVTALNKANWKVSVGLLLTEDEKESYQANIQQFIKDNKDLVVQAQYTVSFSLGALTGDDAMGEVIRQQFDAFYAGQYEKLTAYGDELGAVVADAFSDGMLDIDEVKAITELQNKMGKITSALATSEFEASLQIMEMDYSGGKLDADTFRNLQEELKVYQQEAEGKLKESLTLNYSGLGSQLREGAISQETYESQLKYFQNQYLSQKAELSAKTVKFQSDTIMKQYADELATAMPEFQSQISKLLSDTLEQVQISDVADSAIIWGEFEYKMRELGENAGLRNSDFEAIKTLYQPMTEMVEDLDSLKKQMVENGISIPAILTETLSDTAGLGALTGNIDAIHKLTADEILNSDSATEVIENSKEQGGYIPEGIAEGIETNGRVVQKAIQSLFHTSNYELPKYNVSIKPNFASINPYSTINPKKGHADGGIFDTPHVAWFAEKGPEAAIPLDGSANAMSLWQETGRLLGAYEQNNYGRMYETMSNSGFVDGHSQAATPVPVFSPQIYFQGTSATKEEVQETIQATYEQFVEWTERLSWERSRSGF